MAGLFPRWLARCGALLLSLVAHGALLAWLLTATLGGESVSSSARPILVELTRPPPPPPPPPQPPKETPRQPERKLAAPAKPLPSQPPAPVIQSGPPVHEFATNDNDWVAAVPGEGSGRGAGGARRVPPDYAVKVKSRIIAKLDYPQDAVYEAPRNFKGDPKVLKRQCTVPYEIVVDRNGRMISHHLDPCGDDLLDAAAEAALLKAGPFPPPPDLGADQYVIYGSANFRVQ